VEKDRKEFEERGKKKEKEKMEPSKLREIKKLTENIIEQENAVKTLVENTLKNAVQSIVEDDSTIPIEATASYGQSSLSSTAKKQKIFVRKASETVKTSKNGWHPLQTTYRL
jgi:hypothetical protein